MLDYILPSIARAETSIPSTADASSTTESVEEIVEGMLSSIITLFTDNIGAVLTFAVSFMVLALLLAVARRFFRL